MLALLAAVLFGSLDLAGTTLDRGEAKVDATSGMRLAQAFLRANLEEQHPLRMRKIAEFPLLFAGERDEFATPRALPARVTGGGIWLYRLAVKTDERARRSCWNARCPISTTRRCPSSATPSARCSRSDIAEMRIGYFGREPAPTTRDEPTWRDRWDDPQRLPLLIRIDVVPKRGPPWPTLIVAPREARRPDAGLGRARACAARRCDDARAMTPAWCAGRRPRSAASRW